jgi:hypothetical protein
MKIVFYSFLLMTFSVALAEVTPKNIYDAIFLDKTLSQAQKKDLFKGMYPTVKGDLTVSDKKDFAKIFGFVFDRATFNVEADKATKSQPSSTSATLTESVTKAIGEVAKATDKKLATKAALQVIGRDIASGVATASGLKADEVGAALIAGMTDKK